MAGRGTGVPIRFYCRVARANRDYRTDAIPPGHEKIVRTGLTRAAPNPNSVASPRKMRTSCQYRCECGHVGWTCLREILDYPLGGSA